MPKIVEIKGLSNQCSKYTSAVSNGMPFRRGKTCPFLTQMRCDAKLSRPSCVMSYLLIISH